VPTNGPNMIETSISQNGCGVCSLCGGSGPYLYPFGKAPRETLDVPVLSIYIASAMLVRGILSAQEGRQKLDGLDGCCRLAAFNTVA